MRRGSKIIDPLSETSCYKMIISLPPLTSHLSSTVPLRQGRRGTKFRRGWTKPSCFLPSPLTFHQSSDCFSLMSKANNSVLCHLYSVFRHLVPPLFYNNLRRCKNLCLLPRDMGLLCNDLKENGLQANDNKTNNIRQR